MTCLSRLLRSFSFFFPGLFLAIMGVIVDSKLADWVTNAKVDLTRLLGKSIFAEA